MGYGGLHEIIHLTSRKMNHAGAIHPYPPRSTDFYGIPWDIMEVNGLLRFKLGIKSFILGKIRTRAAPRIASNGRELKILSTDKLIEAPLRPPYSVLPNNLN